MQDTHNSTNPPLSPGKLAILPEQLTMVAPSDSSAVAVYCGASLGKQKAFQLAAVCTSFHSFIP